MYLFDFFRSFLPMRNPIGFGASDFVILAIAILLTALLVARAWLEPWAREIAHRTALCMALLFALPIALRLALLAHCPVPTGTGADDFAYLLLGDTLRHFRLANPAHPLHQFFEQVFVLQQPTYSSIFPLGQGIVMAFGRIVFQSFWAGVLISTGALCALVYWMLRAWVAPVWALAGGLLAVIQFGVLSTWVNSYWGGAVSGCAGCLVFGALPRLRRSPNIRNGVLLGLGLGLQILTRPFETIFLAIAVVAFLVFPLVEQPFRLRHPTVERPFRLQCRHSWRHIAALSIVLAALGLTLLQNKAVTHSWTTMPYMLSRYQYGVPATFTFEDNPVPHRPLTAEQALDYRAQAAIHGPGTDSLGAYFHRLLYRFRYLPFFLLAPLYFALAACLPTLRCMRDFWVVGTILLFALGTNFYPFFFPHYVAAIACLLLLLAVRGLENLNRVAGRHVFVLCCASFLFWFGLYLFAQPSLLALDAYQSWNYINYGDPEGRIEVAGRLAHSPGQQLVFVRYSPAHRFEEWIHNAADIDSAHTVWANDLGAEENEKLLHYYPNRKAWLLEPDARPPALAPYVSASGAFVSVH